MQWLSDLSLKGKRVLVRVDFNVPLTKEGEIADDFRIKATIPTLQYILSKGGKPVLMSHLGSPKGKKEERLSMDKAADKLKEHLGTLVIKAQDCIGQGVEELAENMKEGEVLLLENVRFHKEEEENDAGFAQKLAKLADVYVQDAFGVLHREHASVVGVVKILPSFGGLLLKKEIEGLTHLLKNPAHPMIAIIGGSKIESKLPLIDCVAKLADEVLLGNVLANEITQKNIVLEYKEKVIFPLDGIPGEGKEYDIGPKTQKLYQEKVKKAKTIFWAGPLGKYEEKMYAEGSKIITKAIGENTSYAVAGGGNLLDFLGRYNLFGTFDHISTGGSSMLGFLGGRELPGLKVLGYYND